MFFTGCSVKWANNIAEKGFNKEAINEYDEALKIYNKGIKWNKKSAQLYYRRGSLHNRNKNYTSAIKDFSKSIGIDSLYNNGYPYWSRAISKERINDFEGALLDYNSAVLKNSKQANFFLFRGVLKHKMKDQKGALSDSNSAISIWNNYYIARDFRSILKVELKDYNGAMEDFNYLDFSKDEELKPEMSGRFRYRGIAKLNTKDTIGACNDWKISAKHNLSLIHI